MFLLKKKPLPGTVPALFLHIQKTAGTSIVHIARQYYGQSITSHGDCWKNTIGQLSAVCFISGHIGYHFAQPLMTGRYTFTFLRDPAERILSMYYFCKARDPKEFAIYQKAHELSLADFLAAAFYDQCIRENIWNNQVWQLAHGYANLDNRIIDDFSETGLLNLAKEHLSAFSHIGFTETFDIDSAYILKALGLPKTKGMPTLNANPERPLVKEQPEAVKKLLSQLTELDTELCDHARQAVSAKKRTGWRCWL